MSAGRKIVYPGNVFRIAFARDRSGASPAEEFYEGLSITEKAQLMDLFHRLADADPGKPRNPEKFGSLDDGLYELKSFQIRMPFAYAKGERGLVLITHGFIKKRQKAPPTEIERAKRILKEDAEFSKVCVITDHANVKREK